MKNSVLLVDDSKENIDGLRSILEQDYNVYVALSGEGAMKIMERVKPDIILLDVVMPGMGGFDVLQQMKKNCSLSHIPVIFITGATDSFNEAKGLFMGAVDYISKPYDPDIVCIKVKNHIVNKMNRDNLEKLVEQRTAELSDSRKAVILGMSLLAEGRDKGTGNHIQRMQKYTEILAKQVHRNYPDILSKNELRQTILYAPLHDIGKVCVPDSILLKEGPLTQEEFELMKSHTTFGKEVLQKTENLLTSGTDTLRVAIEIAESHHEKYDGSGYPNGISGTKIPVSARIVALTDIYDALTSVREYKPAFSHEKAYDIIINGDGRTLPEHFDPIVLEAFKEVSDIFNEHRIKAVSYKANSLNLSQRVPLT